MEVREARQWTPIYIGVVEQYGALGSRNIKIERGGGAVLRVVTAELMTKDEIAITGRTPNELEEKLVMYGGFSDAQAREVIRKVMFRG